MKANIELECEKKLQQITNFKMLTDKRNKKIQKNYVMLL